MDITYLLAGFRKVTKEEFFAWIGDKNIHPSVRHLPYSDPCAGSDWKTPMGRVVGLSVLTTFSGHPNWKPDTDYYLPESV